MEMLGICQQCGRPANHSCALCGSLVCADHYDSGLSLCVRCANKPKKRERDLRSDEVLR